MSLSFLQGIAELLFPPRCVFCHQILKGKERPVCSSCRTSLAVTEGGEARQSGEFYSVCVSPLYYTGTVRDSLLRFKFRRASNYAGTYGKILADCVREQLAGRYDIISWVPLSRKRQKTRGYDQAMLLAMATALELDDVAVETLAKVTDVPAQSGIQAPEQRRANVLGVYQVKDPELVGDNRVLLIDDIVTTGATLSECARVLREAGAKDVVCATLARGRPMEYARPETC